MRNSVDFRLLAEMEETEEGRCSCEEIKTCLLDRSDCSNRYPGSNIKKVGELRAGSSRTAQTWICKLVWHLKQNQIKSNKNRQKNDVKPGPNTYWYIPICGGLNERSQQRKEGTASQTERNGVSCQRCHFTRTTEANYNYSIFCNLHILYSIKVHLKTQQLWH